MWWCVRVLGCIGICVKAMQQVRYVLRCVLIKVTCVRMYRQVVQYLKGAVFR